MFQRIFHLYLFIFILFIAISAKAEDPQRNFLLSDRVGEAPWDLQQLAFGLTKEEIEGMLWIAHHVLDNILVGPIGELQLESQAQQNESRRRTLEIHDRLWRVSQSLELNLDDVSEENIAHKWAIIFFNAYQELKAVYQISLKEQIMASENQTMLRLAMIDAMNFLQIYLWILRKSPRKFIHRIETNTWQALDRLAKDKDLQGEFFRGKFCMSTLLHSEAFSNIRNPDTFLQRLFFLSILANYYRSDPKARVDYMISETKRITYLSLRPNFHQGSPLLFHFDKAKGRLYDLDEFPIWLSLLYFDLHISGLSVFNPGSLEETFLLGVILPHSLDSCEEQLS